MARRRRREGGKPVPSWLLREWGDRAEEAGAYCRAHGIPLLVVLRYRARAKGAGTRLRRSELAEIATWIIVEEET